MLAPGPVTAATECVRVVVDRSAAETHCTNAGDGSTAAEALAKRAQELSRPAPRYDGNFLCAIDGYPEAPDCGNDPPKPYWSVWYFKSGKWIYSSVGVADLLVEDRDGDGHPDPLGFRFLEVDEAKAGPRANPGYPAPSPSPTSRATTSTPRAVATGSPRAHVTGEAKATGSSAPVQVGASGAPAASGNAATPTASDMATAEPPATVTGRVVRHGFPLGTLLGGVLAATLLGAAAVRFRRAP